MSTHYRMDGIERTDTPPRAFAPGDELSFEECLTLKEEEILQIFREEPGLKRIQPMKSMAAQSASASPITAVTLLGPTLRNPLYRCQSAEPTPNGERLVLRSGTWMVGKKPQAELVIRESYRHHWDIIQAHFADAHANRSTRTSPPVPVVISGSPGSGKSVEGLYIMHQIFYSSTRNPPPIIYVPAKKHECYVYFRGHYFRHNSYEEFTSSSPYHIMVTQSNGRVWHLYDSMNPGYYEGFQYSGPTIIITSPGRATERDMKDISKNPNLTLYLPPPNDDEMEVIRRTLWNDPDDSDNFISRTQMQSLISKYGCIPRTVFEFGNSPDHLQMIEAKFNTAGDVESMLNMVGGSTIDHEVASGNFLHIMPYIPHDRSDEEAIPQTPKRSAGDAEIPDESLTASERIAELKAAYTKIVYVWASDYIRDLAFQTFLTLTADRMLQIILNHTRSGPSSHRGLLLEPFVHKLLNESGVRGRMRNLETDKDMGIVTLGPWPTKYVFQNHSEIQTVRDVYNVPMKSNEPAIDSIVPYDGILFQITAAEATHGINRPRLDTLMKSGIFRDYYNRNPKKSVRFIWIVEARAYDAFPQQFYHRAGGKVYAGGPTKNKYPGVDQYVFEVDMRRVYKFHSRMKRNKPIDMSDRSTLSKLEKAIKKATIGTSGFTLQGSSGEDEGVSKGKGNAGA